MATIQAKREQLTKNL
jgi:hypothetical protein